MAHMKITVTRAQVERQADQEAIGARLKTLREQKDISQRELSRRIAVSPSYLSAVERGEDKINLDIIKGVMSQFEGLNIDWLITGRGQRFITPNNDEHHEFNLDINAIDAARQSFYRAVRKSDDQSAAFAVANEARHFRAVYAAYMAELRDQLSAGVSPELAHQRANELCRTQEVFFVLNLREDREYKGD